MKEFDTHFDFVRCQRGDGSYYGTATRCVSGTQVGPKEVKAIKARADGGDKKAKQALEKLAADGDKDAKAALGGSSESKPAIGAAEKMTREELEAVPEGGKVDQADGTVYQKGDDGRFYMVQEDGSVGSLDYKPGEVASAAKYNATLHTRQEEGPSIKTAQKSDDVPKDGQPREKGPYKKGEFAPDKDAWRDPEKLEAAAEAWRQRQGLSDVTSDHDKMHAAVHAFTGRTSEDLAQMQGHKGKNDVTTTEEILVNLVSGHAAAGGGPVENRSALMRDAREMRYFFEQGEGLSPNAIKRWDRDSLRAVKIFEQMSKQPGFDDFSRQMENTAA